MKTKEQLIEELYNSLDLINECLDNGEYSKSQKDFLTEKRQTISDIIKLQFSSQEESLDNIRLQIEVIE